MANDNEVSSENLCDFTFDELEEAFFELMDDFKKLKLKNNKLNENISVLTNKEEKFLKEHEKLIQDNKCLKEQNLELTKEKNKILKENQISNEELKKVKPLVEKFTYSSEKLNLLLSNQRAVFDKADLGYKTRKKQKYFKNFFIPASSSITCYSCGRLGHKSYQCLHKNSSSFGKVWVPKGTTSTNPKGPKMTWVPKAKT